MEMEDNVDDKGLAANLKSRRVWLSAGGLFTNNDGKLNVNTTTKKGLLCLKIYLKVMKITKSYD